MAGLIGSLCCVTPVVLVLFGLASVTVANNWGNLLYGEYSWWFRGVAILSLAAGLVVVNCDGLHEDAGFETDDTLPRPS